MCLTAATCLTAASASAESGEDLTPLCNCSEDFIHSRVGFCKVHESKLRINQDLILHLKVPHYLHLRLLNTRHELLKLEITRSSQKLFT